MKFDKLHDWLSWQENLHSQTIDMGLDRIRPVYQRLITQNIADKVIVVGGTNGKGSTTAFLESVYVSAGYKVGAYTSPHLFKYNERIRIDGDLATDEQLCNAFERVNQSRGDTSLTYFEFGTLAAFDIFQQSDLDIAILEVGLGGRLDAVNLVDSDIAVVTNIALDHQNWLGGTREAIAFEKLGICRRNKPLIIADDDPPKNVPALIAEYQAELCSIGKDFGFLQAEDTWQWWSNDKKYYGLPYPALHGFHQLKNAATALMCVHLLEQEIPVSMAHIRVGLSKVSLPGRFQIIQREQNLLIFDVAHNPHGVDAFLQQLQKIPRLGKHKLVIAMLEDKNVEAIIEQLKPLIDEWYLAGLAEPRGLDSGELLQRVESVLNSLQHIQCFEDVPSAFRSAFKGLEYHDKLIVLGSFYTVNQGLATYNTMERVH